MPCSERTRIYVPFPKVKSKCGLYEYGNKKKPWFNLKNNMSSGKMEENGLYPSFNLPSKAKKYVVKGKKSSPKKANK